MQNYQSLDTNINPQYLSANPNALYSPQPVGSSGTHTVARGNDTPSLEGLQKDVRQFVQVLLSDRQVNIVTSPSLVNTTEEITAWVMNEAGLKGTAIGSGQTRPNIENTLEGIHVHSRSEHVDKVLKRLDISHTTSSEIRHKGPVVVTAELNNKIEKDTKGMITDFLKSRDLTEPNLMFRLVTWLFQYVSWKRPFDLMNNVRSSGMTWNNTTRPEIQWMTSCDTNSIAHTQSEGYDFVSVPVKEKGMKAVLVLPPDGADENSDDLNRILSNGLASILGKKANDEASLTLPKFKFDYEFTTKYPAPGVTGKHKAALNFDQKGADVAAISDIWVTECLRPNKKRIKFDRPFYFSIIKENANKPSVVAMAKINQPWNS